MPGADGDAALLAVLRVQESLDRGLHVPHGAWACCVVVFLTTVVFCFTDTDAHTAASMLLLYFASLPQPLLPRGMAKYCDHCSLQRTAAVTLLNAVTKPAALATFWATLSLFQDALQPHHGEF